MIFGPQIPIRGSLDNLFADPYQSDGRTSFSLRTPMVSSYTSLPVNQPLQSVETGSSLREQSYSTDWGRPSLNLPLFTYGENSLREKQESELAALKKEVESVSLLLEDLEKEENELKEKHASLTQSVQMEESQLEFCVPVLEEHYQKHQKDLETSITVHQQELQELKATLESSR